MTQYEKISMEEEIKNLIDDNARLNLGNKKGLVLNQALPYLALLNLLTSSYLIL